MKAIRAVPLWDLLYAMIFPVGDSPGAELVIICRTRQTPTVEIIPRFVHHMIVFQL